MDTLKTSKEYEAELNRIFDRFNHHFWKDELPEVIITFTGTRQALSHMTGWHAWKSDDGSGKYELNVSAYSIDRSPEEICETILHEQCHLYNNIHGITDCTNKGRYHNKHFKRVAEDHGLNVTRDPSYGWSITKLDDKAKGYVRKLKVKKFEYHREKPASKGSSLIKFLCSGCGKNSVYATRTVSIICGYCGSMLLPVAKKAPKGLSPGSF